MSKNRFVSCLLFLVTIGLNQMFAQENINATGGKATGIKGTVNYSIGQTVFNTFSSDAGSVSEGVQQPYEIFITTGIDITTVNLSLFTCNLKSPTVKLPGALKSSEMSVKLGYVNIPFDDISY